MKTIIFPLVSLLICILSFSACKKKEMAEAENNDSFNSANTIELNREMKGYLQTVTDIDFYTFVVNSKVILDINVSPIKGVNHSVKIWHKKPSSQSPVLVKIIDDGRKSSNERMRNFTASAGTYFISIQHGDGDVPKENTENPYSIMITYRDFLNEEEEPNDSIDKATLLEIGASLTGYFSPAYNRLNTKGELREEDWFAIPVICENGQPVLLDITLSGVPGINSVLEIYDPNGKRIMEQDANPNDAGESILGFGIKESGTWYVVVSAKGKAANHENPYSIEVTKVEYDASREIEPNNSIDKANDISGTSISGSINYQADIDFFKFTPTAGIETIRVELSGDDKSDYVLSIYSQQGKRLFQLNNGGAGVPEVYPNLNIKESVFFAVSMNGTVNTDNSYKLIIEPLKASAIMEIEPNDTKEDAMQVISGEIRGYTSTVKDIDYYYLKYNGRVHVDLEVVAPQNGEIKVSVTDPMGFALKTVTVSNAGTKSLSEMIDNFGYIRVETVKPDFDNPYEIGVKLK